MQNLTKETGFETLCYSLISRLTISNLVAATSRFFEKGLDVMEAAAIIGHKDLRLLKRYTHLRAEDLARTLG